MLESVKKIIYNNNSKTIYEGDVTPPLREDFFKHWLAGWFFGTRLGSGRTCCAGQKNKKVFKRKKN